MRRNGTRYCDVCDREVAKGARYLAAVIERDHVPPNANIADTGFTVDALGNVRLDICWDCRTGMSLTGEEMVN